MIRNRIVQLSGGAVVGMSDVALIFANALDETRSDSFARLGIHQLVLNGRGTGVNNKY